MVVEDLRHTCGFNRFKMMFEGISNMTYGTKKTVSATLNWLPLSFRSLGNPYTAALPMLTLHAAVQTSIELPLVGNKSRCSPIEKGHEVQETQDRQQPQVYLPHQRPLGGMGRTWNGQVIIFHAWKAIDAMKVVLGSGEFRRMGIVGRLFGES